jgi:hypothetical protein
METILGAQPSRRAGSRVRFFIASQKSKHISFLCTADHVRGFGASQVAAFHGGRSGFLHSPSRKKMPIVAWFCRLTLVEQGCQSHKWRPYVLENRGLRALGGVPITWVHLYKKRCRKYLLLSSELPYDSDSEAAFYCFHCAKKTALTQYDLSA